ncbi:dynein light chain Tctex-type 5-like [Vespa velutina]|uniref:dynein light chain Tctex-type 5-like n=1 Tax=Vespa velutina TaxID=202808 RepID=UPI001FB4E8C6|nr:dynein light chain Tctex-type 5-like [Vespa velutina]
MTRLLSHGILRTSMIFRTLKGGLKIPKYQNTYRLESFVPLKIEVVDKILKDVMSSSLQDMRYNPIVCLQICKDMSAKVRDKIFKKSYDRYKYSVVMTIIQKLGQHVEINMACLWDLERDNYSTYVLETTEFIALGLVIATYYE